MSFGANALHVLSSLEWRNRHGFAKIAKETGAAVIPMFTVNISQVMSLHKFGERGKSWCRLKQAVLGRFGLSNLKYPQGVGCLSCVGSKLSKAESDNLSTHSAAFTDDLETEIRR